MVQIINNPNHSHTPIPNWLFRSEGRMNSDVVHVYGNVLTHSGDTSRALIAQETGLPHDRVDLAVDMLLKVNLINESEA